MKNFKLILTRSLTLTLLAVLMSTNILAQSWPQSGDGSEGDPYLITSTTDWNAFADAVNGGTSYNGEFLKLTADITVTINNTSGSDKIVGAISMSGSTVVESKWFSGTFDGDWHTLTFNVGDTVTSFTPPVTNSPTAPFRVIDGATIKNLTVDGTIISNKKYNAGFVGYAYSDKTSRENNIKNCTSSIEIDCSQVLNGSGTASDYKKWDCSSAGFVAQNQKNSKTLTFENCIFDGSIYKGDNANANRGAGFVSYNNSVNIVCKDCLMAGTIDLALLPNAATLSTFTRDQNNNKITYEGQCLYMNNYGNVPQNRCIQASYILEGLSKKYTIDEVDYYVPVQVTELKNTVYVAPVTVDVDFYGKPLVKNTDYTIVVEKKDSQGVYVVVPDGSINDPDGAYRVTLTAVTGSAFEGENVYEFKFITESEKWYNLEDMISAASAGDTIDLQNDFYASSTSDQALNITKNLTINLNGYSINRSLSDPVVAGQVVRIAAGVNVNIVGPGTITGGYNKAETDETYGVNNDGGGIYNMGNLVLTDVAVTHNTCLKRSEGTDKATARGGGIYNGIGSSFNMTGGEVSYNVARGGGGAVYCEQPTSFSMIGVLISHNESESKGGGLRIRTKAPVEALLKNCTIEYNYATETGSSRASEGGGVYMQEGKLRMDSCLITNNKSAFAGAGFFSLGGTTYATNCTITNNSAFTEHENMYGGGICLHSPSVYTMNGGIIENNSSFQDGGGIYVMQGATFNVLGNILINDNFRVRTIDGVADTTSNNAYLGGSSVINIVGPLDPDARIHITGHGLGGVYTSGLEGYATADNFVTDDQYQAIIDETTGEFRLVPYEWDNPGAWFDQAWWDESNPRIPTIDDSITVKRALVIPENYIAYAESVCYLDGTVIIKEGGQLIIKDHSSSTQLDLLFQKSITAVPSGDQYGWTIVSIPIDNAILVDDYVYNTNIITRKSAPYDFDLLRYDEPKHYWDSYNDHTVSFSDDFKNLKKGLGYLYRNNNDMSLEFFGTMNVGDVDCAVSYTSSAAPLSGVNLIGNPYTEEITILNTTLLGTGDTPLADNKQLSGFYKLSGGSAWTAKIVDTTETFALADGFLVQVPSDAKKVRFSKTPRTPSKAEKKLIMFSVSNNKYEDNAYVVLGDCLGLNKIEHINVDIPMIYIRQNDEDYAIAAIENDIKSVNLNFKAKTTGSYTLKMNLTGDFKYVHLIDKLAGKDIDMLKEHEYQFVGSSVDNADRFIVRLGNADDSDAFAYLNGDDIIVSGDGELQVFDVTGRLVLTHQIHGIETFGRASLQNGVYILRLEGKTQKIVVK
ncbi:MAG: T9SS type A sorting domain-containing protein [Bacteroidales bacterium]|nr:T9SS type A sorting domain-containing protein [Bacteroidales bacterium]